MQSRSETIPVTFIGGRPSMAPRMRSAMEKSSSREIRRRHHHRRADRLAEGGWLPSVRNTLAGDLPYGGVALAAAVAEAINNGAPLRIIELRGAEHRSTDILWMAEEGLAAPEIQIEDLAGREGRLHRARLKVTNMLIFDVHERRKPSTPMP